MGRAHFTLAHQPPVAVLVGEIDRHEKKLSRFENGREEFHCYVTEGARLYR